MKKQILFLCLLLFNGNIFSQPVRIAILDFDNISGIAKYDGLGKAMSSMLISDIESNVSSKRLQLVERAQINKIMKEQNLQKSASFDKNTAVKMGKLLGVSYLLIGDIYILDNALVINARLADASSGDIKFSEKQEGKINEWLTVKTKLGKGVATSLSMPFTEPRVPDAIVTPAVLTTYANAIEENDKGNFDKAETLISTAKEFDPGFRYLDDLRDEVEKLKKQVAEQGKKIEVLEKSGGRVVDAKTYDELNVNFKNELTSYEERKKIWVEILNKFSDKLEKNPSGFYYTLFRHYGLDKPGLNECNLLITDMLKLKPLIYQDKMYAFHKQMYFFLGQSLYFSFKRVYFDHDFSESDYVDFRGVMGSVINNAFVDENERICAKYILLTCLINSGGYNKNFKQIVKVDFLESQRNIFKLLKYPYGDQIMSRCEVMGSEFDNDGKVPNMKSVLGSTEEITYFLSSNRNDFKKVASVFMNPQFTNRDVIDKFYNSNNDQNRLSIDLYLKGLNKICQFFAVPSLGVKDIYQEDQVYRRKFLSEIPEIIPMNQVAKNTIISVDSVSRRYSRIQEILEANKVSDPCRVSDLSRWLIHTSDSIALNSDVYLLNDKWPIGSRITVIYNNGKDTSIAFIVGKKISNSKSEFQMIDNDKLKNYNNAYSVLFQTEKNGFTFYDLVPNINEKRRRDSFYSNFKNCEQNTGYEKVKKERDEMVRQQENRRVMEEQQKQAAYREKMKKAIGIFNKTSFEIDTIVLTQIIDKVESEDITLDSLFNFNFQLLSEIDNYIKKSSDSKRRYCAQFSIPLNIYLIDALEKSDFNKEILDDFINAAIINLAHGYLLCSIKYKLDAFSDAYSEYNNVSAKFKFSETFNSFSRDEMILADWSDFVDRGLVSRIQIQEFNKKYKIVNNF